MFWATQLSSFRSMNRALEATNLVIFKSALRARLSHQWGSLWIALRQPSGVHGVSIRGCGGQRNLRIAGGIAVSRGATR